jgi:hypothetical protein
MGTCTCNERDDNDPETDFELRLNLLRSYILLKRPSIKPSSAFPCESCDFQDIKSTDEVSWVSAVGSSTGVVNKSNNLSTQPPAKHLPKVKKY